MRRDHRLKSALSLIVAMSLWCSAALAAPSPAQNLTEEFPNLKQYLFEEPETPIRFGIGLSPARILKSSVSLSLSLLQVHWMNSWLDWEIFNASYSTSVTGDAFTKTNSFAFRSFPKIRITPTISIGPLIGLEYVSFQDVKATIITTTFPTYTTPEAEPFSANGLIIGAGASQIFPLNKKVSLRFNQVVYKQDYPVLNPAPGWQYNFQGAGSDLNFDQTPIKPGVVVAFELSLIF